MAIYGNMALTAAGLNLFTKVQTGTTLTFTRMQIGSGQLTGGQTPATMTALNNPIAYFNINLLSTSGSTALVTGIYTNSALTVSTYTCEIGIFATDPQAGEILYAYANAGTQGDTIPPASSGPLSKQFQISIAVGNASSVTANTPATNYIPTTQIGVASGIAPLDSNSLLPRANLPIATTSLLGGVKAGTNTAVAADGTISVPSFPWSGLTSKPTTISGYGITDNLVGSITAGNNIAVTNPTGLGPATVSISGIVPVANGGTGSSTQNFVDTSTTQNNIGGAKTFTSGVTGAGFSSSIADGFLLNTSASDPANHSVWGIRASSTGNSVDIISGSAPRWVAASTTTYTPYTLWHTGSAANIVTSITAGSNVSVTNPSGAGAATVSVSSFPWSGLTGKPTTISGYGITDNLVGSITAGNNIAVTNPTGLGAATVGITGIIPIANGGTGSSTQNFVDLTTAQTIGGAKTFSNDAVFNGVMTINGSGGSFANSKAANGYQKLPGGIIFQWCVISTLPNAQTNFNWPTTFPTACYVAVVTPTNTASGYQMQITATSTTGGTVQNNTSASQNVYCIAIGS